MMVIELATWLLFIAFLSASLVLYIRVHLHDWGMVGTMIIFVAVTVLLGNLLLGMHGYDGWDGLSIGTAIVLALVGAPFAVTGIIAGLIRDPPPRRQIVVRLVVLGLIALALTVAL